LLEKGNLDDMLFSLLLAKKKKKKKKQNKKLGAFYKLACSLSEVYKDDLRELDSSLII
jgi:hypothetical protein